LVLVDYGYSPPAIYIYNFLPMFPAGEGKGVRISHANQMQMEPRNITGLVKEKGVKSICYEWGGSSYIRFSREAKIRAPGSVERVLFKLGR
jgi:hypothetical protein